MKKERRRRHKRPLSIIIVASILMLLPFYNIIGLLARAGFFRVQWPAEITFLDTLEIIGYYRLALSLAPFLIGTGLLLVRRWAWWMLLAYSFVLLVTNVFFIASEPEAIYNWSALIQTALVCGFMLFFLRRDISAPYMKMYPRGWRYQLRSSIHIPVSIDNQTFQTRDISSAGLYALWTNCPHTPGDSVKVEFELEDQTFSFEGGVATIVAGHGAGIAFRNVQVKDRKRLSSALSHLDGHKRHTEPLNWNESGANRT